MRKIFKYAALALVLILIAGGVTLYILSRPDVARFSTAELSGRVPVMASQKVETFPTVNVPEATRWPISMRPARWWEWARRRPMAKCCCARPTPATTG